MKNYKGIYYNESKDCKYFEGGAHFRYKDLFQVLLIMGGHLYSGNERENEKEKTREKEIESHQNKFKNDIFNLEKLIHKEQKTRTRNVAQFNYNNNPNTMNSFNIPVTFKSYNSLNKDKIKQSKNSDFGEYFGKGNNSNNRINNYLTSKKNYNKNINNGFVFNNEFLYKQGRYLSNNINLTNNYLDNNDKKDSINININNNYLSYLNNRNESKLSNDKRITKNILNKKINAQNGYLSNINIYNICSKLNKNNNNISSCDKNSSANNNVKKYVLKSSSNNNLKNKSMNLIKTDTMNKTKSSALIKNYKLFNGNYIKTIINNNSNNRKKIDNCFSFIGFGVDNKTKQNNNNFITQTTYGENIALRKYIKKKINQMCTFKTNNNTNFNKNIEHIKKGISRNLDGPKRIYSGGLKFGTVNDFLNKKHEI